MKKLLGLFAISIVLFLIGGCNSSQTEGNSTSKEEESPPSAEEVPQKTPEVEEALPEGMKLMSASDCNACHKMDIKLVGPSYTEIAKKYRGASTEEIEKLSTNILNGSSGVWGQVAMPGHSTLKQAEVDVMVKYILSLKSS